MGVGPADARRCHRGEGSSRRITGKRFAPGARAGGSLPGSRRKRAAGEVRDRGGREKTAGGGISMREAGVVPKGGDLPREPSDPVVGVGGPARANWGVLSRGSTGCRDGESSGRTPPPLPQPPPPRPPPRHIIGAAALHLARRHGTSLEPQPSTSPHRRGASGAAALHLRPLLSPAEHLDRVAFAGLGPSPHLI